MLHALSCSEIKEWVLSHSAISDWNVWRSTAELRESFHYDPYSPSNPTHATLSEALPGARMAAGLIR